MHIENEELKDLRTLGNVKSFIREKLVTGPGKEVAAKPKLRRYDRSDMLGILPHGIPFLFLDEAEIEEDTVRARYTVKGDEDFLTGHFKGNPVFPASIVFEAIGQAACLWVLECAPARLGVTLPNNEVLFASMENAHFHRRARPGDTLEFEAKLHQLHAPLAVFDGMVRLRGERLAQIERLVLAFGQEVVHQLVVQEETDQRAVSAHARASAKGKAEGIPAAARRATPRRAATAKKKDSGALATSAPAAGNGSPAKPVARRPGARAKTASS